MKQVTTHSGKIHFVSINVLGSFKGLATRMGKQYLMIDFFLEHEYKMHFYSSWSYKWIENCGVTFYSGSRLQICNFHRILSHCFKNQLCNRVYGGAKLNRVRQKAWIFYEIDHDIPIFWVALAHALTLDSYFAALTLIYLPIRPSIRGCATSFPSCAPSK